MIKNGKEYDKTTLTADICIVGTGPAGMTVAWELISKNPNMKIIMIDGSRDLGNSGDYWKRNWPNKDWLYNGEATGQFASNEPNFLVRPNNKHNEFPWERERTYGGTSTHWGGQSRPLDPIAFEGIPNYDGWPITHQEMEPYFSLAANLCKLDGDDFTAEHWAQKLNADVPRLSGFETEMYQFIGGSYQNFATRTFGDDHVQIGDTRVLVIRNASLLDFDHNGSHVSVAQVRSMADEGNPPKRATKFKIKATNYVLAMGAVANAKQMLLSEVPNDNIGKYFMCHPFVPATMAPIRVNGEYLTSQELKLMSGNNGQEFPNGVKVEGRFIPNAEKTKELGIGRCWFWAGAGRNGFYFEQAPNPNSRITLTDSVDPIFCQQQTSINWELTDLDENTYNQVTALFREAVKEKNPNSDVITISWEDLKSKAVVNGHHLGTTRMSNSPQDGVVDSNLRSHELDNLYVAGSSVWPSAGISNPTFTIIALAIRLARHLSTQIEGE
ncbi:MAG: GMC family oxidoreductase [Flavobacteriales bacterium]|nr:GMC family oxidoreductase [Flavobacteriales bacterium]